MWCTRLAAAALSITSFGLIAGCSSSEEGETSIVSEARADVPAAKDYGWRTSPNFAAPEKDQVREFY